MKWNLLKAEVQTNIEKANITNKEAIKLIMFIERKINTAWNERLRGASYQYVVEKHSGIKWIESMGKMGNPSYAGYYYQDAPYYKEWQKYCQVAGYTIGFTFGDALA
jgi:hypothetical protein